MKCPKCGSSLVGMGHATRQDWSEYTFISCGDCKHEWGFIETDPPRSYEEFKEHVKDMKENHKEMWKK